MNESPLEMRTEHDLLGEEQVPADAYYGIQTLRAMRNFDISGVPISHFPQLIKAIALVKQACASANLELGLLEPHKAEVIILACQEVANGALHDQFTVDLIQGGAGTSTNMNANEVIANRALELMGHKKGDYHLLHPNNDVNMSQSTNDVYPTAARLAVLFSDDPLIEALQELHAALKAKGEEFKDVLKMGRTQLQDAVPYLQNELKIATYDIIDGITEIYGLVTDSLTGLLVIGVLQNGADSGIERMFSTNYDLLESENMIVGKKYYYAVTAYTYNPDTRNLSTHDTQAYMRSQLDRMRD